MFKRLGNLIRGFFSLFIGGLEKRNPEALLEVEKENLRKNIVQFNQGLAAHAGLCERLMAQVKKLEKELRPMAVEVVTTTILVAVAEPILLQVATEVKMMNLVLLDVMGFNQELVVNPSILYRKGYFWVVAVALDMRIMKMLLMVVMVVESLSFKQVKYYPMDFL